MKKIFTILLLVGCLLTSSCSDWLDVLPKDKQTTDMYWESAEDVESILAEGYSCMRNCIPYMIDWGELRGGSVVVPSRASANGKIQNFQVLPNSSKVKWSIFYQTIGMANAVLKYAPNVMEKDASYHESQMNSHRTEAYFIRGLMYLYLVRNFGEVPLITEPYVDDEMPTSVAKSSEKEILEQIKSDVRVALETNAAKEYFEELWATKGRSTKWALYALMAETCLWAEDYDECITYANNLINATAAMRPVFMSNSGQWFQIFYPGNSNESIFELQFDGATYNQTGNSPTKILPFSTTSTTDTYMYSEAMTLRLQEECRSTNRAVRTYFGSCAPRENSFLPSYYDSYPENAIIWKYSGLGTENLDAIRAGNNLDANFIIYRMADVMLMKAEAFIRKGGNENWTEAIDIMNQIRKRSELAPLDVSIQETSEIELLQLLLNERDMEFAAEGKRWYDLLRLGKQQNFKYKSEFKELVMENNSTAEAKWLNSTLENSNAWYLPLPEKDVNTNPLLEQNPYYAK